MDNWKLRVLGAIVMLLFLLCLMRVQALNEQIEVLQKENSSLEEWNTKLLWSWYWCWDSTQT